MEKRILTLQEACAYTGYTESYMYKLTSTRQIPHSKPNGKKIFFDKEKLDEWLLGNPIATNAELETAASTYVTTHKKK